MKRRLMALTAILSVAALSSCDGLLGGKSSSTGGHYTVSMSGKTVSDYPSMGALQTQGVLPSVGSPKILVIPIYFTDSDAPTAEELENIHDVYFGTAEETGWQSLASYYEASSYGQLNITGSVATAYQASVSSEAFNTQYTSASDESAKAEVVTDLVNEAVASLVVDGLDTSDYDSNRDGYIDGVEAIYFTDEPYEDEEGVEEDSVWWNWTTVADNEADKSSPVTNIYFWSGYRMITRGHSGITLDAHTIVHETGHMLGLDDYYDYDGKTMPAGGCDMMDFNIGDHDAYSKMLLGWVSPTYVDGTVSEVTLTLNSFTETGDCVILTASGHDWNETPYDEYMVLQYYTPTGLNEADAVNGYDEWADYGVGGLYKKAGLQIFHVDARPVAIKLQKSRNQYTLTDEYVYVDEPIDGIWLGTDGNYYSQTIIGHSNTASYSFDSEFDLIAAISADGSNAFQSSMTRGITKLGSQKVLYSTSAYGGGASKYTQKNHMTSYPKGLYFNSGDPFDWSIEIDSQTDESITITISKSLF